MCRIMLDNHFSMCYNFVKFIKAVTKTALKNHFRESMFGVNRYGVFMFAYHFRAEGQNFIVSLSVFATSVHRGCWTLKVVVYCNYNLSGTASMFMLYPSQSN